MYRADQRQVSWVFQVIRRLPQVGSLEQGAITHHPDLLERSLAAERYPDGGIYNSSG